MYVYAHMCFIDVDKHQRIEKDLVKLNEQNSKVNHTGLQVSTLLQ